MLTFLASIALDHAGASAKPDRASGPAPSAVSPFGSRGQSGGGKGHHGGPGGVRPGAGAHGSSRPTPGSAPAARPKANPGRGRAQHGTAGVPGRSRGGGHHGTAGVPGRGRGGGHARAPGSAAARHTGGVSAARASCRGLACGRRPAAASPGSAGAVALPTRAGSLPIVAPAPARSIPAPTSPRPAATGIGLVGPTLGHPARIASRKRVGGGRSPAAARSAASPLTSLPLSPSLGGAGPAPTSTPAHRAATRRRHPPTGARSAGPLRSVVELIVHVIPSVIWFALGAAVLFALVSGIVALTQSRRARAQARRIATVSAEAVTDPLTGVLNRRGFTAAAEREIDRARRYARPFLLAYVDVRGLKAVNDTAGHLAGDRLLREAARLLQSSARAHDFVGRIGGDELAMLLVEQSGDAADSVTRRIHAAVPAGRAAVGVAAPWDLTIGTAAYPQDGESFTELLQVADRRLYEQRGIGLR